MKREYKEDGLKLSKGKQSKKDFMVKEIEHSSKVDLSNVIDLYDEDGMIDEIDPDHLIIEADEEEEKKK